MSNQVEYRKKCSRCGREILMRNVEGNKWQALETDGSEAHKCITSAAKTETKAATLTTTPKFNPIIENEIIALKNRVSAIENWIHKLSESWVMQS